MLEVLLILALFGNGFLLQERGEMEHSNKQMQQIIVEKDKLLGSKYHEVATLEGQLVKVESAREEIFAESEKRGIELEELRNSSVVVTDYLDQAIPASVVEHLQAYSADGVRNK